MGLEKRCFCWITIALWVLLLAGCATWTHPTKGEEQYHADLYACEVQAAPAQDPWRVLQMKVRCMQLKGWSAQL